MKIIENIFKIIEKHWKSIINRIMNKTNLHLGTTTLLAVFNKQPMSAGSRSWDYAIEGWDGF